MALRRAGVVLAGVGVYGATVYLTFSYLSASKADRDAANELIAESGGVHSYVSDPKRTDTFNLIAYGYDDQIGKDEMVMGINLMRRWMLFFHARGDVLEVGAGTGRNIDYYPGASTVRRIVLTDTSDKMLLRARQKIGVMSPAQKSRFVAHEADAADLRNYSDSTFDTVVDSFGLCSFEDPVAVLREMQRVCRPDGKIVLLEHGRSKTYDGLSRYLDQNAERHAKNWGCVWNRDIDAILHAAGLEVENMTTWHFGTTYYVVGKPGSKDVIKTAAKDHMSHANGIVATCSCDCQRMPPPVYSILPRWISSHLFPWKKHSHTVSTKEAKQDRKINIADDV
uniref:Methyltransferase type 11 domain-containing protein n=1 Tax=Trieres chinensis TaxID=1514140 RepID=A0A7S2AAH9_TRICV|mmetsp:Transcript_9100/g.19291  ORF Transcript_9100/g.19291 Transcript_9100/m.19291 type:complete len:338 (+) Transcript_9100:75-1088(+)